MRRSGVIQRLLPDNPLTRALALRSVLYALGEGAFLTGSAFFFTHIVGLRAAQVGLGLTIAGVASFLTAVPLGKLADTHGPKRVWFVCSLLTAVVYLSWPFVRGFWGFVAVVVTMEIIDAAGSSARQAYTLDAFPREERVRSLAFMRSALNIGFTAGAGIGGAALALPTDAGIRALPIATAVILGLGSFLILSLPVATHRPVPVPVAVEAEIPVEAELEVADGLGLVETVGTVEATSRVSALRNRGFLFMSIFGGVQGTNQVLLNIVIPLWLVQETDAPRVLLAWLFGTNTVLAVLLQVPASRGSDTVLGALRASRISGAFFVLSCLIVLVTHNTIGWVTIVLVWIGHVTVTGAELFQSASSWGFSSELSDPHQRGEYAGVGKVGSAIGTLWAPAVYTFLAMEWHALGWVIIAAIVVAATVGLGPSVRAAERYLAATTSGAVRTATD